MTKMVTSLCIALLFPALGYAGYTKTLNTTNFTITISQQCPEGHVTCETVKYIGLSKKTRRSIELNGTTLHTTCADGSPCRFVGYVFENGNITYKVLEQGLLQVIENGTNVLLEENGTWD